MRERERRGEGREKIKKKLYYIFTSKLQVLVFNFYSCINSRFNEIVENSLNHSWGHVIALSLDLQLP